MMGARLGACAGINLMTACLMVSVLLSSYIVKFRLEPMMGRVAAVFAG